MTSFSKNIILIAKSWKLANCSLIGADYINYIQTMVYTVSPSYLQIYLFIGGTGL
jgi:hypothetical protein